MSIKNKKLGLNVCTSCGYDLTGNMTGHCPECGTVITSTSENAVGNEYGYVSFVLGVALFVTAPVMLNFNVSLWSEGPKAGPTSIPMDLAYPAGLIGMALVLLVALFSIGCGVRGLSIAARQGRTRIVPLAGTFISAIAFALWIVVAIDLVMILSIFRYVSY